MTVRPYGTWPSPFDADTIAGIPGRAFDALSVSWPSVRWATSRPAEEGRVAVVEWRDGEIHDLTPPTANVRTRVHEYGGRAVSFHGDTAYYSEFADGRLHRLEDGIATPLTPEPPEPSSLRYADGDLTPDGRLLVCVRERHEDGAVDSELVAVQADGPTEPRLIAFGHDFYAAPRVSPDGRRLAWICWDHPRMPWDGTELWVAELAADGTLTGERLVAGGPEESVIEPSWSPDGRLHFVSDRNGWWNLHREDRALTALEDGEIGTPAWVFGTARYAFLGDGRIACVVTRAAMDSLELLDPESGELRSAGLPWTDYDPTMLAADGSRVVFAAASPTQGSTVVVWDAASGEETVLERANDLVLDPAAVSEPRAIEFPTTDGATAHAFFYPPASADSEGPADELPPLRVVCHGGPTGHCTPSFSPSFLFWTQRGIGVVDVNHRGSSGFGRAYRRLLDGRWGEIDWKDCVAAARYLAEQGEADPQRTWVEGGSAGGYVVLCALTFDPTAFAAGVSLFGVADAEALAVETHKFESRYLDSLIGPYPERADLYRARSPVHFADRLERPLLLLQGLDDKVVPPSQAEAMVEVVDRKGIPHAYVAFAGEGHGFRKRETVRRALEATLSFVGQIFGFEPADELEPLEIAHSRLGAVGIAELTRNAVDVLPAGGLEAKLKLGRPLRVKLGIDVTSPDIHLGRGIPLQRMRAFQDEGHKAVFIVGDYTTRIGDPSGRSSERPILSDEEIDSNAQIYLEQAKTILRDDPELLEVRYNGEWLSKLSYADVVRLGRIVTVARMLERDDFDQRYRAGEPISVSELLYPLMQAYDSVAVEADVELGGTDQLYNLLAGRQVMEAYGLEPQVVLTTPLLLSWDGEKMSSSVGNNVPLTAAPEEMFGRTMRIPDSQLEEWWTLVAEKPVPPGEPMQAKLELARWIVTRSHGEEAARAAEEHFRRVTHGEAPADVPEHSLPAGDPVHLPALLADAFGVSTSEARRLISQGGVKLDGDPVHELDVPRERLVGTVLQAGKRRFVRLREAA